MFFRFLKYYFGFICLVVFLAYLLVYVFDIF